MKAPFKNITPDILKFVERNVTALLNRKKEDLHNRSITEKFVSFITRFASSMASFYLHTLLYGVWILWNRGLLPLKPFDKEFIYMGTFAAVEAIFLTTFVLIGQRHMNTKTEKWEELNLQVSLLTEHEVTKILSVVSVIAQKLQVEIVEDKEIKELSKTIRPENVLDTMEKAKL
ncbi:MAG: DUF1003 domain-containing protein [Sphingobacteriia bacterium]|jgi:uncharacterized membrane protein